MEASDNWDRDLYNPLSNIGGNTGTSFANLGMTDIIQNERLGAGSVLAAIPQPRHSCMR
jgi:hypothetical protein